MEAAPHQTAVRLWAEPYSVNRVKTPQGKEFDLYNIPYYYTAQIEEKLKNG